MPSSKSEEGVLLFKIMIVPRVGLFRAIPPTPPRYLLELFQEPQWRLAPWMVLNHAYTVPFPVLLL